MGDGKKRVVTIALHSGYTARNEDPTHWLKDVT
jgi:hypothetical protein